MMIKHMYMYEVDALTLMLEPSGIWYPVITIPPLGDSLEKPDTIGYILSTSWIT